MSRRASDGSPLRRDPRTEAQIRTALALPGDELRLRAAQADPRSPNYLQEEALVYLIRAFHQAGDDALVGALAEALLRRCARFVDDKFRALGEDEAHEAYQEVIRQLFERILDLEGDRGDFLQVRFWLALERLAISTFRRYAARINADRKRLVRLDDVAGYEREWEEDGRAVPFAALIDSTPSVEGAALGAEGLALLPEPQRTAFILHHSYGWQIESINPAEPTLSKHFGKTPRTIRNWLSAAERALERWREEIS